MTEFSDHSLFSNAYEPEYIKNYNTTFDALWFSGRFSKLANQNYWNATIAYAMTSFWNIWDNAIAGGGFEEKYRGNWEKYEAYYVAKQYNTFASGNVAVNTTTAWDNEGIYVASFLDDANKQLNIFVTNPNNCPAILDINIKGLDWSPVSYEKYNNLEGSLIESGFYNTNIFSVEKRSSTLISLRADDSFSITYTSGKS